MSVTDPTDREAAQARIEVEAGRLFADGEPAPAIARTLGVDVRTVTRALQRIGAVPVNGRRPGRPRKAEQ